MMFPLPVEERVEEPMEEVEESCEACGAKPLFRYRLVDYRGWLRVVKCRTCLEVKSSERIVAPPQAS